MLCDPNTSPVLRARCRRVAARDDDTVDSELCAGVKDLTRCALLSAAFLATGVVFGWLAVLNKINLDAIINKYRKYLIWDTSCKSGLHLSVCVSVCVFVTVCVYVQRVYWCGKCLCVYLHV